MRVNIVFLTDKQFEKLKENQIGLHLVVRSHISYFTAKKYIPHVIVQWKNSRWYSDYII